MKISIVSFVGLLMFLTGVSLFAFMVWSGIVGSYSYEKEINANWSLAKKASTLSQKAEYVDKFAAALQNSGLQGTHDALFLPTDDNSFDNNLKSLSSLQERLHKAQAMDENSTDYQVAIGQITEQEQKNKDNMFSVFSGCWWKVHYYWLWNSFSLLAVFMIFTVLTILGWAFFSDTSISDGFTAWIIIIVLAFLIICFL